MTIRRILMFPFDALLPTNWSAKVTDLGDGSACLDYTESFPDTPTEELQQRIDFTLTKSRAMLPGAVVEKTLDGLRIVIKGPRKDILGYIAGEILGQLCETHQDIDDICMAVHAMILPEALKPRNDEKRQ